MVRARKNETPLTVVQMNEQLGFVSAGAATYSNVDDFIPTQIPGLDKVLGGGIPMKRMTEIFAPEQTGKSTLAIDILKKLGWYKTKDGKEVIRYIIDTEGTSDRERMQQLGVDMKNTFVFQPKASDDMTVEDVQETLEKIIDLLENNPEMKDRPVVVIWDSIGGTLSRGELEHEAQDDKFKIGMRATAVTHLVNKIGNLIKRVNLSLIVMNQVRKNINGYTEFSRPGGEAFNHFASLRLSLTKGAQITKGANKEYIGHALNIKTDKNKQAKPKQKYPAVLLSAYVMETINAKDKSGKLIRDDTNNPIIEKEYIADGIDFEYNLVNNAKVNGVMKASGAYLSYPVNGEDTKAYFDDWVLTLKHPGNEELKKQLFQDVLYKEFPYKYPPLDNKTIDVTKFPEMTGVKQHYEKIAKEAAAATKANPKAITPKKTKAAPKAK